MLGADRRSVPAKVGLRSLIDKVRAHIPLGAPVGPGAPRLPLVSSQLHPGFFVCQFATPLLFANRWQARARLVCDFFKHCSLGS
jgi:hypothetical protein